jgi:hypothetical protein
VRFESFSFGSIRIDGLVYEHDLIIDRGKIRRRKKKASKEYRAAYGHTPLSIRASREIARSRPGVRRTTGGQRAREDGTERWTCRGILKPGS